MTGIDHTHDPAATSWVSGADRHDSFPVQNLPLGVFSTAAGGKRIGVAIGDYVLDLRAVSGAALLPASLAGALGGKTLNALFALPRDRRLALRHALFDLLTSAAAREQVKPHLHHATDCRLHLPAEIGDYTDFYVGIHHATNIGRQFRPDSPLLPNYKHVPIGYHGRASSVRASSAPVLRPRGQRKAGDGALPEFGASRQLDYELELGVWIAGENELGDPVAIDRAAERIAGLCILNDWSARDIQAWEYQPLGPFLAKNFLTSVSPWIISAEALAPFRIAQPARPAGDPHPLPYLWDERDQQLGAFALVMEVWLSTARMREAKLTAQQLSSGPACNMYWTAAQMIAHHTAGGCNLRPGDLLGTGTISGPERGTFGSLMEISQGGADPLVLSSGETRSFLEDGDELVITARADAPGARSIGFGECRGMVFAAR